MEDEPARGGALARHLAAFYDALDNHLTDRAAGFDALPDDVTKGAAITEMRELVVGVRRLQSNMAWIDAALAPPLDLGTTYFVEDAARRLVAADAEVTVVAAHEVAYATVRNPFADAIQEWSNAEARHENVIVVFIPRREQHSGLLHPLILHELGHAAVDRHGLVQVMLSEAAGRKRVQARFARAVQALAERDGVSVRTATGTIGGRLMRWLEEALCDAIAAQWLGPTYLYSFLAEVAAANMDDPGTRHPPPRQRIALLTAQLDKIGWGEVMRRAAPELDSWVRGLQSERPLYDHPSTGFLVYAIDALAPALRNVVKRRFGRWTFEPDDDELRAISRLLARGIPPAQHADGTATSRPAVILCSWLAALARTSGDLSEVASAADAPELASLLPKGLEMTALVEAWDVSG